MRSKYLNFLPILAVVAAACAPDAAPEKVESTLPWFWQHYSSATDAQIAAAAVDLASGLTAVTADKPIKGSLAHLPDEAMLPVGLKGKDLAKARGMFIVNEFACTLTQLEKVLIAQNQDVLYADSYDKYERKYTSDKDAYLARKIAELTWDVNLTKNTLGDHYNEFLHGGTRFAKDQGKVLSPFGPILLARTWLPEPAVFTDSTDSFKQDYQLEIYMERTAGHILHVYGAWREGDFGVISTESDTLVNKMTDAFIDWDTVTAKNCKDGKP